MKARSPRSRATSASVVISWVFVVYAALASCQRHPPTSGASSSSSTSSSSTSGSSGGGGTSTSGSSSGGGASSSGTGGAGTGGGGVTSAVRVLTQHNDNLRTGANLKETELSPANVGASTFGMLFARPVDDQIYAQPLVLPGVTIPGKGIHDVVYVATMNDSVYAFDANDPAASAPLWQASFIDPANGITPASYTDLLAACGPAENNFTSNVGIVSTPVIEEGSATMWVVAKTKEDGQPIYRLHALDITTGAEKPGSPVLIQASASGTGLGSMGGTLVFDASLENQRPALALTNGVVYIGFSSYCDSGYFHGWLLAYDAQTLAQTAAYNVTPNGWAGGIWMSGQGPSVDEAGNVWVVTANGTFDADMAGGVDYGSSALKLSPTLSVLDYFTPYNVDALNAGDLDLSAGGALLLASQELAVLGGKGGYLYVLDRTSLGQFHAGSDSQIVQSFQVSVDELHGSPIVWDLPSGPRIWVWGEQDYLFGYQWNGSSFQQVDQSTVILPSGSPGGILSLSANGTTPGTGIVWATHPIMGDGETQTVHGVLQAYDAQDLTKLLWDTQMNAARDDFGNLAKFCPPTVANGKVYLATFSNQLAVYGQL
jgi:hypothetical protein